MKTRHIILIFLKKMEKIEKKDISKQELQSLVYFLSIHLKYKLLFKEYYYGPYSLEIEDALNDLVGAGFLNIKLKKIECKKILFESLTYQLSEISEDFINKFLEKSDLNIKINEFFKNFMEIQYLDCMESAIAAKVHYIIKTKGIKLKTDETIEDKVRQLSKIPYADSENVKSFLKKVEMMPV